MDTMTWVGPRLENCSLIAATEIEIAHHCIWRVNRRSARRCTSQSGAMAMWCFQTVRSAGHCPMNNIIGPPSTINNYVWPLSPVSLVTPDWVQYRAQPCTNIQLPCIPCLDRQVVRVNLIYACHKVTQQSATGFEARHSWQQQQLTQYFGWD